MGPEDLAQVLGQLTIPADDRVVVGFDGADDCAVVRLDKGRLLLQTVDFFTPVVDDPYQFGQIAAANSLSDIYAMGGKPIFALNIAAFPIKDLPKKILVDILQGGADMANEAGITIVGGHSIDDKEPKYGLVVTGEIKESDLITNAAARPGNILILTKPLGTGIISTAIKKEIAPQEVIDQAVESMTALNSSAADLMLKYKAASATDVTGFGLLGHLGEMCRASRVSAKVEFSKVNFLKDVKRLAQENIIPGGTRRNLDYAAGFTSFSPSISQVQRLMLADAQTSGGLLISIDPKRADEYLKEFNGSS
ncbi:MAG: selenide, water dikinase SelD, partial [Candidatus Neomarinimicrobiota bacterium]